MVGDASIRPPTSDDLPALLALIQAHCRRQDLPDDLISGERLAAALFGQPPRIACLTAARGGALVAHALFHPCWDAPYASPGVALTELYVRPDARRAGLGRALLAAVADRARADGATFLHWSAAPENADALAFYRAVGGRSRPVISHTLTLD